MQILGFGFGTLIAYLSLRHTACDSNREPKGA